MNPSHSVEDVLKSVLELALLSSELGCLHEKYLLSLRDQLHQDGSSAKSRWSKYLVKKKNKNNLCIKILTVALFLIAKDHKQPKCPSIRDWLNKL